METDRLRWFLAVAQHGGVRDAARSLSLSPGAVSKAMTDLEDTLGRRLFVRSRRGFSLTEAGTYLREKGRELLRVEEEIKDALSAGSEPTRLAVVGTEPLLALHLSDILRLAKARFPDVSLELRPTRDDADTRKALDDDPASIAVVTEVSRNEPSRSLPVSRFGLFAGKAHVLADRATTGIPVAEVIQHAFVVPERTIFGPMVDGASADGWRDDAFPRRSRLVAPTLALVKAYVESGHALAYLPLGLVDRMNACRLKVTRCPYSCTIEAHAIRGATAPGWIRQLV